MLAKMRGVRASLMLAALVGCAAPRPAASAIKGSLADVTARRGERDGFVIEDGCRDPDCWAVRGRGSRSILGDGREAIERWRADVLRAVGRPSVNLSAYGAACRGVGLFVYVDDYRDVDGALERVGALLRQKRRGDEVMICVQAAPALLGARR